MKEMHDADFCKDVKSYLQNVSFKEKAALEEFLTEAIRRLDMARSQKFPSGAQTPQPTPQTPTPVNINPYKISYTFLDEVRQVFAGYQPAKRSFPELKKEDVRHESTYGDIAVYNPIWEPKS